MTASSLFGAMVLASDVENAVKATLQEWLPTYLAELERRTGRQPGDLPNARAWSTTNRFTQRRSDQLPEFLVISPGLAEAPHRLGDGSYQAWWKIAVAVVTSASTREASNELAKLYAAAVRSILLQRPSLGGFAAGVHYADEGYEEAPADFLDIGSVAEVDFNVLIDAVVDALAGPDIPIVPPALPVDRPAVAETLITVSEVRSLT